MDFLYKVVSTVNTYLTDYILIFLLVGTGIFFTIRTRFVQVRCFGEGMKSVFGKISLHGKGHGGSLTSFQALATIGVESHKVPSISKIIPSVFIMFSFTF